MKHQCNGCPINIISEEGENISNYGCLPCYSEAIKWYKDTGKVWACHENPAKPCLGFLTLAKKYGEKVSVNKDTVLINEQTTLEEIYETSKREKS
jgi:hypothetical protein